METLQHHMIQFQHEESKRARDTAKSGGANATLLGLIESEEKPPSKPAEESSA